jgi:hypothetical protein
MMRHLKILGLLATAAVASLAFAATALADSVTSPTANTYTGDITAVSEGHSITHNPIANVECASTFTFKVEAHPAGGKVSGAVSHMQTGPCTNSWHVTVVTAGTMSIEHLSGYDGDLYSSGMTIEKTRFGITCRYATSTTTIGIITGGAPATIHVNGTLPFHSGSGLCGAAATRMTGSYTVTSPSSLYVDNT